MKAPVISKKILIVDDKIENIIALEVLLKNFDVEFVRAFSGNEALAKTIEHDFALALMDVQMPSMDGFETVKLMRQVEKTRFLPVIFLSAIYSEEHYHIQGIEAGAFDFITKPFVSRIVIGKVKLFLDIYEQKQRLEMEIEQRKKTELFLRETEKKLLYAKIKAEESDKLKTAFLANMSHEIRTPLTSIVGFAGLLSELDLPPEKKKEFAGFIYKSSEGLINIINDILDVAKIEAGQFKINKNPVNINDLLNETYSNFKEVLKKKGKAHIDLKLFLPDNAGLTMNTDENRLKQIFSNLLTNAIKFTVEGSIVFGYQMKNDVVEFYVQDTGIGIPREKFDLIFDRFQKLHSKKIQNAVGTGLGLSIVKKIVEMLEGKIWVNSTMNKGSKFSFSLPYIKAEETQKKVPGVIPELLEDSVNWSTKNLLIVEDEYSNYILLESWLTPTRAKIQWAKNGREAISKFMNGNKIDAVLMDIKMPVMTGLVAYKKLRKLNKKVPIIAQTAYAMTDEKEYLEKIGFNGYLAKPIMKKELLQLLESVFT